MFIPFDQTPSRRTAPAERLTKQVSGWCDISVLSPSGEPDPTWDAWHSYPWSEGIITDEVGDVAVVWLGR